MLCAAAQYLTVHVAGVLQAAEAVLTLGCSLAAVLAGLLQEGYCAPAEDVEGGVGGQGSEKDAGGVGTFDVGGLLKNDGMKHRQTILCRCVVWCSQ